MKLYFIKYKNEDRIAYKRGNSYSIVPRIFHFKAKAQTFLNQLPSEYREMVYIKEVEV
jgi:hypothetical protein